MRKEAVLYVKAGCPWCMDAEAFLKEKGIPYRSVEVRSDPDAMQEMVRISGQRKAPTLKLHDAVLADFDVEELIPFLKKHGYGER